MRQTRPEHLESVEACPACGQTSWTVEQELRAHMHPEPEPFRMVRCSECGLVYLNPRVPAAELGRYYTEAYLPYRGARAWGMFAPLVEKGFRDTDRKRVAAVLKHADVRPGTPVLDVGCGKPTFLEALRARTGCHAMGTDFSDEGWLAEVERWHGLELQVGDIHDVTPARPPRVVTMWHYLEHDYRPRETLRRVAELCRGDGMRDGPDGRNDPVTLIIEVPDHDGWTRIRHGALWAGYHAPRHASLFTAETLSGLLERSGWKPVTVERKGTMDPYILHWMSRMEAKGVDWSKDFAPEFPGFLAGKVAWSLRNPPSKEGLGILTAVARLGG